MTISEARKRLHQPLDAIGRGDLRDAILVAFDAIEAQPKKNEFDKLIRRVSLDNAVAVARQEALDWAAERVKKCPIRTGTFMTDLAERIRRGPQPEATK